MNMHQRVEEKLEKLAGKGPESIDAVVKSTPEPGYIIGIPAIEDGSGASLSLVDYDRYSVTVRHLEVFNQNLKIDGDGAEAYLRQVAAEISQRLIYLEEPLALIELNKVDGIAQLRSDPPNNKPDESTYWEVMVQVRPHPQARVSRCHWTAGSRERTAIAYPATFATLGRLAEDLASSLAVEIGRLGD